MTAPVLSDGAATYTPGVSEVRSGVFTFTTGGLKNQDAQWSAAGAPMATRQYDAFGNVVGSSGTWSGPFGYGGAYGYQEDASGLKLLGHRYYDPSTGSFLTRDPIKDGRNWYAYCGGDPLAYADPEGLRRREGVIFVGDLGQGKDKANGKNENDAYITAGSGNYAVTQISQAVVNWLGLDNDIRWVIRRQPGPAVVAYEMSKADVVVFYGHGNDKDIWFGPDDKDGLLNVLRYIDRQKPIELLLVLSCCTFKPGGGLGKDSRFHALLKPLCDEIVGYTGLTFEGLPRMPDYRWRYDQ